MNCEKCGKECASGRFCSVGCRNSRVFSEESKQKKREGYERWLQALQAEPEKYAEFKKSQAENGVLNGKRKGPSKSYIRTKPVVRVKKIDGRSWEERGLDGKRKMVIEEQGGQCNRCSLNEWLGNPLTLEIDHKDGNHQNNLRGNLEALCPNCHSLTPTWRGRNKRVKVSDDDLLEALNSTSSVRQALLKVGLAPKGKNYPRAQKLLGAR